MALKSAVTGLVWRKLSIRIILRAVKAGHTPGIEAILWMQPGIASTEVRDSGLYTSGSKNLGL